MLAISFFSSPKYSNNVQRFFIVKTFFNSTAFWVATSAANTLKVPFSLSSASVQAALSFFNYSLWILRFLNASTLNILISHAVPAPVMWNLAPWEVASASALISSSVCLTTTVWGCTFYVFNMTFKFSPFNPIIDRLLGRQEVWREPVKSVKKTNPIALIISTVPIDIRIYSLHVLVCVSITYSAWL